jgi:hypothetical protein
LVIEQALLRTGARASCPLEKTEDLKKQDTRDEVAYDLASQNLERDAPRTDWGKMPQLREETALRGRIALPEQSLEQNVPRTDWDCKSQPHEEAAYFSPQ